MAVIQPSGIETRVAFEVLVVMKNNSNRLLKNGTRQKRGVTCCDWQDAALCKQG